MKKIILILFIFLFLNSISYASDDLFFMGEDEYNDPKSADFTDYWGDYNVDVPLPSKPKLKEKFDLNSKDIMVVSDDVIKLNIEKRAFLSEYRKNYEPESGKADFFQTERFKIFSDNTKELSNYMTNNYKATMNASYILNDRFSIQAGHEVTYVNPDATLGSKKLYFNPRLNITDKCYFDYISKYNQTTKNIEQEVGVNYKPSLFKDNASFGVKATAVTDENNQIQSKRLKFSTDFYIF